MDNQNSEQNKSFTANDESPANTEWTRQTVKKINLEIKLLKAESKSLKNLSMQLSSLIDNGVPAEDEETRSNLNSIFDDVYFKWKENASRYEAQALHIERIIIAKTDYLLSLLELLNPDKYRDNLIEEISKNKEIKDDL